MLGHPRLASHEATASKSCSARFGLAVFSLVAVQAVGLRLMGRPALCECGELKLWFGEVRSLQTSQQISDWYSFTHIEHGLIFYFIGWLFFPRVSISRRFLLALTTEIGWEFLENTPWFVEFYRKQALALGYTGDSIVNSVSDVGFMAFGYLIAAAAPVWISVAVVAALELFLAYSIRDCLALNILNFFHPFDFISRWQSQGR